jgi:hypothetical protein
VPAIDGVRDADPAGRALHGVLAPRAPDGQVLAEQLADGWRPPGLSPADAARFADAARRWRRWFAAAHPAPGRSSWVRERLEHRFSVGAAFGDEQVVLHAPEYGGGRLDAYHLEIDPSPARALHAPPMPPETVVRTTLPARATYPGMPAERWWQFEDATVNLPAVSAGPPDLARLLLIEFANVYGNDWWVIPVDLRVGAVHRMTRLTVTDTFGDTLAIRPTDLVHADGWSVFRLTDAVTGRPGPPLLPLLPTASTLTEGEPVEEVLFARDEMANLAWAVERVVESATGRPRRRADEVPADGPAAAPPPGAPGALAWRLLSPPPPHWVPLLPVPLAEGSAAIQFRRGRIPRPGSPAAGHLVQAVGRVLEPGARRVTFREEEITRAGVRVTRVPVVARWLGGTTAAWTGRRAETGRGEASSGLTFDDALPDEGR